MKIKNIVAGVALAAASLAFTSAAHAGTAQTTLVSQNPVDYTPNLLPDGTDANGRPIKGEATYALESANGMMYVGGQFVGAQNAGRTITYDRSNFLAFDATTGAMSSLAPAFNGSVWAIRANGTSLYVAGDFTSLSINGMTTARAGLVKIDAATGVVDTGWNTPWTTGSVSDMQIVNGRLVVGGTFPEHLLALNLTTGGDTGYINLSATPISGTCVNNAVCGTAGATAAKQVTGIYRFAVNAAGTRLVGIGNFSAPHPRALMVDLGATTASLDPWYYRPFAHACELSGVYPAYLRDVDFSPDGSYFVVVATGYVVKGNNPALYATDVCDAAARLETNQPDQAQATWINATGGDTLHSVNITDAAVYVQGHNRWMDNIGGKDFCAPGCFAASPGIQALDPATGRAIRSWTVPKTRGVGGKDLLSTAQGLWVGSDGAKIGGEYHLGIALLPLSP